MSRDTFRRVRGAALKVAFPLLIHSVGRLPLAGLRLFARGLARLLWITNRKHRERALEGLAIAFPERSDEERRALCRASFFYASLNAAEALQLLAKGREAFSERLTIEGWEHVETLLEQQRRVLLLTAHCGFWEMIGVACARGGLPLLAMGRRPDDAAFVDLVQRVRTAVATEPIERGSAAAPRQLRRALKGEGALAMLVDQDTSVDGVWVPFFGHLAHTPSGAAEIAMRHEMSVIPAFMARREGGHHVASFGPALELGDTIESSTAAMTAATEAHIRRYPAQWVWWHRRWRRRPPTLPSS